MGINGNARVADVPGARAASCGTAAPLHGPRTRASRGDGGPPGDGGGVRAPEPPRPVLRPLRHGPIGPLHIAQVVCWQAAVLSALLLIGRSPVTVVAGSTAAAIGVLLPVVRVRGRLAAEWLWLAVRYATRRTRPVATAGPGAPEFLPSAVLPGSVLGALELDGVRIGIIEHPRGATVVFASQRAGAGRGPADPPSPEVLLRAVPATGPSVTVQLLTLTNAAPQGDDEGPAARAYRGLLPVRPAYRGAWLALQVRRTADRRTGDDVDRTVPALLRQVMRRLADSGERVAPLAPDDLAEVFAAVTRIHCPGSVAEGWRAWQVPQEAQVTYQVVRWPDSVRAGHLLDAVALLPGAATVLSLAVRRADQPRSDRAAHGRLDLEVEAALRVCAPPGPTLDAACAAAVSAAESLGATLRRCDGRQRAGAIATSALGGFSG